MSFRAKLRVFFGLIVVVPMIALALVLFELTERSETGKVDAGIASGARTALGLYQESAEAAAPALQRVATDDELRAALRAGRGVEGRMAELARSSPEIEAIELRKDGEIAARAGAAGGVAPRGAPLSIGGESFGVLAVSQTDGTELLERAAALTGLELALFRDGRLVAATADGFGARPQEVPRGSPRDFRLGGREYRGRVERFTEAAGAPVELAVLRDRAALGDRIARSRFVIAGLLLAFVLLALLGAARIGRALEGQIATFLAAARRLGRGDFAKPVPVTGRDEFSELGREFNSMSAQLEGKIEEIERQRLELEEAIRGIGDALATGLDRQGVVELVVPAAVDACHADGGRALPLRDGAFRPISAGRDGDALAGALEAAERRALDVDAESNGRRVVGAEAAGVHALAFPMRTTTGTPDHPYLGSIAIARRGHPFSRGQEDLLEYLAGQAVVSIENASLHETVERQAVTDELTGLANARAFHTVLARESERARRFGSPLALMMVDLDDFKSVNDSYGHRQGDEVLASVAALLRHFSRDIDAPARYGGEELAVILPQTDLDGAALLAERVREAVEDAEVGRVDAPGVVRVTASFGVAALPESARDEDGLVAVADAALYRAKRAGKNRVERAEPQAA